MKSKKILLLSREVSLNEILPSLQKFGDVTVFNEIIDDRNLGRLLGHDVAVSYSYGPIISDPILKALSCDVLNVHPTFLPFGRGIYPIVWAAFEGNPQGATIHRIESGIDTGAIYVRQSMVLEDACTLDQAREILISAAKYLLLTNLIQIMSGVLAPVQQSEFSSRQRYRSKSDGLALMEYFPNKWNTTIGEVKRLGISIRNENK